MHCGGSRVTPVFSPREADLPLIAIPEIQVKNSEPIRWGRTRLAGLGEWPEGAAVQDLGWLEHKTAQCAASKAHAEMLEARV